jgi:integrase
LAGKAIDYHDSALSENTRRAYQRGWEDFAQFCNEHGFEAAPAIEQAVALYLSDRAEDLAPSTLSQRMAAIQHAHDERGLSSPTRSKAAQNVMRGIRRESDRTPEQAPPLLTEHIKNMVDALPGNGKPPEGAEAEAAWLRGKRDRALILMGFAGAFRRSELAGLQIGHIDTRPDGLLVIVPEIGLAVGNIEPGQARWRPGLRGHLALASAAFVQVLFSGRPAARSRRRDTAASGAALTPPRCHRFGAAASVLVSGFGWLGPPPVL